MSSNQTHTILVVIATDSTDKCYIKWHSPTTTPIDIHMLIIWIIHHKGVQLC